MPRLAGIVLAAGRSSRMGRPKALLPCPPDGLTFVAQVVRTLRAGGAAEVVVVGRPGDDGLRREVARASPAVSWLENPEADCGQLSSLLVGIEYAERTHADAVLVLPVDTPLVRPETVRQLLDAWQRSGLPIVRAAHAGRHGHPVLFAAAVFAELRAADPELGARSVVRRDPARVLEVVVDDPGVLRDFDLPEDYRRLMPD